jgi:hypothetical protein
MDQHETVIEIKHANGTTTEYKVFGHAPMSSDWLGKLVEAVTLQPFDPNTSGRAILQIQS